MIAPQGELDIAHVADFRAALREAAGGGAARLVVDLSEVSFIDSSGIGALVDLQNRFRRERRQIAVVVPRGSASAVLIELAGLSGILTIFETRQAALET